MFIVTVISYVIPFFVYKAVNVNWFSFIYVCMLSFACGVVACWFLGTEKHEREVIVSKVKEKIHRK